MLDFLAPPLVRRVLRWWWAPVLTLQSWMYPQLKGLSDFCPTYLICPTYLTWRNVWWGLGILLCSSSSHHPEILNSLRNVWGGRQIGIKDGHRWAKICMNNNKKNNLKVKTYLESILVTFVEKNSSTPSSTLPMRPFCSPSWDGALLICWNRKLNNVKLCLVLMMTSNLQFLYLYLFVVKSTCVLHSHVY